MATRTRHTEALMLVVNNVVICGTIAACVAAAVAPADAWGNAHLCVTTTWIKDRPPKIVAKEIVAKKYRQKIPSKKYYRKMSSKKYRQKISSTTQ
jgi:hypothetical protein